MNANDLPKSLIEAVRHFSDLDKCDELMLRIKWPNGKPACPKCGSENVGRIVSRRKLQCKEKGCRKQFSYKVGTIFEDSPLGLDKWFVAVWCIANCKNGISSYELARALEITQKSAWHLLHRVRLAMQTPSFNKPLEGEIESDETFIGGKRKNMHAKRKAHQRGRGTVGKAVVQGLLERGGEIRAGVVPDQKRPTLQGKIHKHVKHGSTVYTDTLMSYDGLDNAYVHEMIDHTKSYVEGRVHTNGLENFWSLLKRGLHGTYIQVAAFHLFRYVDEQCFRYNARKTTDGIRFFEVLLRVVGRRLMFRDLIGASISGKPLNIKAN